MADSETDLEARVERLENEVEQLRDRLAERERQLDIIVADADLEYFEVTCPDCQEGVLRREAGISWARVICDECSTYWSTK